MKINVIIKCMMEQSKDEIIEELERKVLKRLRRLGLLANTISCRYKRRAAFIAGCSYNCIEDTDELIYVCSKR